MGTETSAGDGGDEARALRAAETRLFAHLGVAPRELWVGTESGGRIRVLAWGEGPPVLHVHGGGAFGSLSAPLAAALPGRRHFLLDRPGFGLSDPAPAAPDVRGRSVAMLVSVLDGLALGTVDVIANSIGAGMSLWLTLDRPGRVRSLALAGGAAMIGSAPAPMPLRLLAAPVLGPFLLRMEAPSPSQVRALFARFGHPEIDPLVADVMLAVERMPAYPRAWWEILAATMTLAGTRPGLELSMDDVRRLGVPMAFAWGARDPMVDASIGRAVADAVPGTRFAIAGVGHCPWLDDARAVAAALEPVLAPRSTASAVAPGDR